MANVLIDSGASLIKGTTPEKSPVLMALHTAMLPQSRPAGSKMMCFVEVQDVCRVHASTR